MVIAASIWLNAVFYFYDDPPAQGQRNASSSASKHSSQKPTDTCEDIVHTQGDKTQSTCHNENKH